MTVAEQLQGRTGLLSLAALGAMLFATERTVVGWVKDCGLPVVHMAGSTWIDPPVAGRWLAAQQRPLYRLRKFNRRRVNGQQERA